jgi:hypothetical protein
VSTEWCAAYLFRRYFSNHSTISTSSHLAAFSVNAAAQQLPAPRIQKSSRAATELGISTANKADGFTLTGPAPPDITSFTANVAFPVSWGTPITWTAAASGGSAPLQYQFWRLRQGVGWTLAQDYSPSNILTWTPGPSDGGTYSLQVFARSSGVLGRL